MIYKLYMGWTIFCIVGCIVLGIGVLKSGEASGAETTFLMIAHVGIWVALWAVATLIVILIGVRRWLKRWNQSK